MLEINKNPSKIVVVGDRIFLPFELLPNGQWTSKNILDQLYCDKKSCLIIICSGSLILDGQLWSARHLIILSLNLLRFTSEEGCKGYLILSDDELPEDQNLKSVEMDNSLSYFDKYKASIRKINFSGLERYLAPWSFYFASIPFSENIKLHEHWQLTNFLIFVGKPDEKLGYLILQDQGTIKTEPLYAHDFAIVYPHVIHNVCAKCEDQNLDFLIVNNSPSDYESDHDSDYHNLESIQYSELEKSSRYDHKSHLITAKIS